jgi:rhamnose utilization protein RhaD (predicted bifunctional aldolase and dehydrogenase)
MDKELLDLIRVSNTVGCDSSLVQGGGGNTSAKTDDGKYMYIKASGTALKDMTAQRGWRRLNVAAVLDILRDKDLAGMDINTRELEMVKRLLGSCQDDVPGNVRPSVECPMHAVLDKCVIHLHAIAAQAYTSAKNGQAEVLKLFNDEHLPPLWVPYANPGFELGHSVFSLVEGFVKKHGRKPTVLFMEKHGLLVSSENTDRALEVVSEVINRCQTALDQPEPVSIQPASKEQVDQCKQNIAKALSELTGKKDNISFYTNPTIAQFLAGKHAGHMLSSGALTPDELAFVKGPILWLENYDSKTIANGIRTTLSENEPCPTSFLVKEVGLFVVAKPALLTVITDIVTGSLFIRMNAHNMGGINALSSQQRDFIKNWEAEQFRVQLAAGGN